MDFSGDTGDASLSTLYEKIWNYLVDLENTSERTNSEAVQKKVDDAIKECYSAIDMVNTLEIFSSNESIDEITTLEIKYLLLPAFLGYFTNKKVTDDRLEIVKKSRDCYRSFIKLCKTFTLTNVTLQALGSDETDESDGRGSAAKPSTMELIKADVVRRQEKIERYKTKTSLEKELQELYLEVKKEHIDEEVKRDYYLKLVKKWVSDALDALDSIETEVAILEHMKKMKANSKTSTQSNPGDFSCDGRDCKSHSKSKFTPFIITKDQVQKQVFGLGYPSIPTVTVDEFYDQRVQQGLFPGPDAKPRTVQPDEEAEEREKERKDAEKEKKEEEEDEEELRRARDWDEYRDDHRRGWGNTHNRSWTLTPGKGDNACDGWMFFAW